MTAKNTKFKRPEEYAAEPAVAPAAPAPRETFFRLKLVPASLVQYAVEKITIEGDRVIAREVITERDILAISLSKIEDQILREIRR